MKVLRRVWVLGIIFSMIFVFASCLLAQEAEQETAPAETVANVETTQAEPAAPAVSIEPAMPAESAVSAAPAEAKPTEWVWGEVVSVDTENKQIVLKHLDYDTYEEVQTTLKVGDKTLFENVAALGEIKAGNHLTADFKIVAGSNIADLIVVEKDVQEESVASETAVAPVPETTVAPEAVVLPKPAPEAPEVITPETTPSI
ncbi:MAG: hypothetical protein AAB213_00675 [Candidatus Omnitrophota bacterium]